MNAAGPTRHEPIGAPGEVRQLRGDRFQFGWRERTETLAEAQADAVERREQLAALKRRDCKRVCWMGEEGMADTR